VAGVVEDVILREAFWPDASAIAFRLGAPPVAGDACYVVRAQAGRGPAVAAALGAALGPAAPDRLVAVTSYAAATPHLQRVVQGLLGLFASVALTVAAIALCGALAVSSFVVAERRRQVGTRRALGATRADVLRHFLVESAITAALGVGLGLLLSLGLLLAMKRVLPGLAVSGAELGGAACALWLAATLAAALPARGAARVPPSLASRGG
jgi:putative ABC transport system permease protein